MVCVRICLLHIPCRIFWCKALCDTPLTYLLLARLGLRGCAWGVCGRGKWGPVVGEQWGFRSCGKWGPVVGARGVSVAVVSGGLWLGRVGSPPWQPLVAGGAPELRLSTGAAGSAAPGRTGSPWIRDGPVSCTGRWTAAHWATRKSSLSFNTLESTVMAAPSFLILFVFLHQFS